MDLGRALIANATELGSGQTSGVTTRSMTAAPKGSRI
jgi:hypothetical protein